MDTDSDETIYPSRGGHQRVDSDDEDSITQRSSSSSSDEAAAVEDIVNTKHVERPLDPRILPAYKQCWDEFYQDEQEYCFQTLHDLAKGGELGDGAELDFFADTDSNADERMLVDGVSHLNDFSVVEAADGEHSYLDTEVVEVSSLTPWPVYYSCAPAHTYFRVNVEPRDAVLHYIRYGGDGSLFDERAHMSKYRWIGWQAPFQDPDCALVTYETLMRLCMSPKNSNEPPLFLEDIACLAPQVLRVRVTDEYARHESVSLPDRVAAALAELQFNMRQRDPWPWPHCQFPLGQWRHKYELPKRETQRSETLDRMQSAANSFCAYLECVRAECEVHPYPTGWRPLYHAAIPHVTNQVLARRDKKKACGADCYLRVPNAPAPTMMSPEERITLDALRAINPDATPCSVAPIIGGRITCAEVYALRRKEIPDEYVHPSETQRHIAPQTWSDISIKYGASSFTGVVSCDCLGPCTQNPHCQCFKDGYHCQRTCQCSDKCQLRFTGCRCHKTQDGRCADASCECRLYGWDCDPEKCHRKTVKRVTKKTKIQVADHCENMNAYYQKIPPIKVQQAQFGWGAFATEKMHSGTYLGDYAGEKVVASLTPGMLQLARFAKLNYAFDLNPNETLDAFNVGNETRFANDRRDGEPNVSAHPKYAQGSHHIAYKTEKRIAKGEELFLEYGLKYWEFEDKLTSSGTREPLETEKHIICPETREALDKLCFRDI